MRGREQGAEHRGDYRDCVRGRDRRGAARGGSLSVVQQEVSPAGAQARREANCHGHPTHLSLIVIYFCLIALL